MSILYYLYGIKYRTKKLYLYEKENIFEIKQINLNYKCYQIIYVRDRPLTKKLAKFSVPFIVPAHRFTL